MNLSGVLVGFILTALGIMLVNRFLGVEYLNRTVNLDFVTYYMLGGGFMIVVGFGPFLHSRVSVFFEKRKSSKSA